MQNCIKCNKALPDGADFCCWCGKKQTPTKRSKKLSNGSGSVFKVSGNRHKPWAALLPAQSIDSGGKTKRQLLGYYSSRTEAINALAAVSHKSSAGIDKINFTFSEIYSEYTMEHFTKITKSAAGVIKASYKYYEEIYGKKFRDIRSDSVQSIVNGAFSAGKSQETCKKIKQLYSSLCKYAMRFDIIDKNYAEFVEIPKAKKKEKYVFTTEQINQLTKLASSDETAKVVVILIYSGLRIGELIDIEIKNVDIDNEYMVGGNKSEAGKNRIIPFHHVIVPYIKYFYEKNKNREYLCTSSTGKKMNYKNFRDRAFKPLMEKINAPELTLHSTRHTFATLGQAADIAPEDMIKLIGHTDYTTTTENYIHQNLDKLKKAVNKI